jgi:hypothetical protein
MRCRVETYSGFRLHEYPRRFTWGDGWLEVHGIVARWITPGGLGFKVQAGERLFLLKHHQVQDLWEVALISP